MPPPPDDQNGGQQQRGLQGQPPPLHGRHRPPPPVIAVLDANHDGIIDANEIADASKALLTLDKNGAGQLTPDELMPPPPPPRRGGRQNGAGNSGAGPNSEPQQ
jgi:hypothetical protein